VAEKKDYHPIKYNILLSFEVPMAKKRRKHNISGLKKQPKPATDASEVPQEASEDNNYDELEDLEWSPTLIQNFEESFRR